MAAGEAKKGLSNFTKGIGKAIIGASLLEKAVSALLKVVFALGKSILVAAQIEELGAVYRFVGENAGYTTAQLVAFNPQLSISGIRQDTANQSLLRAVQANIDLTQAVAFARVGQDAATVGLMESSQAYQRIIEAVAKLFPRLLTEIVIIINLNVEYAKYAKALNKNVNELTEMEKKQSLSNAVMERGVRLSGAYETAMGKVSKRIRSLPRLFQDAQQAIGRHFVPALTAAVSTLEGLLKTLKKVFQSDESLILETIALTHAFEKETEITFKIINNYEKLIKKRGESKKITEEETAVLKQLGISYRGQFAIHDEFGNIIGIEMVRLREHIKLTQEMWAEKAIRNGKLAIVVLKDFDIRLADNARSIAAYEQLYLTISDRKKEATAGLLAQALQEEAAINATKKAFIDSIDPFTEFDLLVQAIGKDAAIARRESEKLARAQKKITDQITRSVEALDLITSKNKETRARTHADQILKIRKKADEQLEILRENFFGQDEDRTKENAALIKRITSESQKDIEELELAHINKLITISKKHRTEMISLQKSVFQASLIGKNDSQKKEAQINKKFDDLALKRQQQKIDLVNEFDKAGATENEELFKMFKERLKAIDEASITDKLNRDEELREAKKRINIAIATDAITAAVDLAAALKSIFTDQNALEREEFIA